MAENHQLPSEIERFFSLSGFRSLLVKGPPGSGKTIFSLQCIKNFSNQVAGIYFSTRVNARSLYEQFPWIKYQISPENIVDATQSSIPKTFDFAHAINYSSLPNFLKELYFVVQKVSQQRIPLIVVDSIDALAANVKMSIEDVCARLVDFTGNTQSKTLLVTERNDASMIDYMVDGVIRFERKYIDNRLLRRMVIEKLRGVEIHDSVHYFTLKDGKFQYFEKFPIYEWKSVAKETHSPIKDGKGTKFFENRRYSSGSHYWDRIFGGFRKGSFVLFEVDEKITPETVIAITSVTPENFLTQDRGVVMISPECLSPKYVIEHYQAFVGEDRVSKCLREILYSINYREMTNQGICVRNINCREFLEKFFNIIEKLKEKCGKETLVYISIDTLESVFGIHDAFRIVSEIVSNIRVEDSLCIALKFVSGNGAYEYRKIADVVIKLLTMNGVIFFYGVKPATMLYNINIDLTLKHPKLVITPVT